MRLIIHTDVRIHRIRSITQKTDERQSKDAKNIAKDTKNMAKEGERLQKTSKAVVKEMYYFFDQRHSFALMCAVQSQELHTRC